MFLFVHDKVATVTRPVLELKGVGKATLRPGETKTVRITVPAPNCGSWEGPHSGLRAGRSGDSHRPLRRPEAAAGANDPPGVSRPPRRSLAGSVGRRSS